MIHYVTISCIHSIWSHGKTFLHVWAMMFSSSSHHEPFMPSFIRDHNSKLVLVIHTMNHKSTTKLHCIALCQAIFHQMHGKVSIKAHVLHSFKHDSCNHWLLWQATIKAYNISQLIDLHMISIDIISAWTCMLWAGYVIE